MTWIFLLLCLYFYLKIFGIKTRRRRRTSSKSISYKPKKIKPLKNNTGLHKRNGTLYRTMKSGDRTITYNHKTHKTTIRKRR